MTEITFGEYHLDLIPFDDDLLSLELETSYKECFLVKLKKTLNGITFVRKEIELHFSMLLGPS